MTPAGPAEPSAGHDAPGAGLPLLLSLAMAQFMVVLDFTIVNVALPSIQGELHVATTTLQWLISAYAVTFGGFLLLGGRLADSYGRARLYRIGLVVFVVASVSGGLAVEPGLLIASRVVQGIGAAMLAPAGLSLLVTSYPGEQERSRALGTYGAVVSAGFASGAVLGGLLVEVTWRLVFFVNVPIGIALLAASIPAAASGSARGAGAAGPAGRGDRDGRGRPARAGRGPGRRHAAGHPAGAAGRGRDRAAGRVRRQGAQGPGAAARPGAAKGPRHRRRQPHADRGRRLQRRPGPADDPVPAGGTRAQPGAHRPVLHSAGGRGVRAVRAGRTPGARARAAPRARHRPVHRAAGPGRRGRRGAWRLAGRAAGGPVRARRRRPAQPGRLHPGRHPRAGRRPVRGDRQRAAHRHPAGAARRSASPSCPRRWSPSTAATATGRRWRCW